MDFAIKAEVADPKAKACAFAGQKTMHGGEHFRRRYDFRFRERERRRTRARRVRHRHVRSCDSQEAGVVRQTSRLSVDIERPDLAQRPLGRSELEPLTYWNDSQPRTEIISVYCQAANKIVGLSEATAAFLSKFYQ